MKKVFIFLVFVLGVLETLGQNSEIPNIVYGELDYTGYSKVTKGAFWSKRPEAKIVYEGGKPEGVDTFRLQTDFFVLFAKGESNPLDINYIVFPKGEMVYFKDGSFYAAVCGNRIANIIRVGPEVIFKKDETELTVLKEQLATSKATIDSLNTEGQKKVEAVEKVKEEIKTISPQEEEKKETWWKKNKKWIIPLGSGAIITAVGFVAHDKNHKWYFWFPMSPGHGSMSGGRQGDSSGGGSAGRGG